MSYQSCTVVQGQSISQGLDAEVLRCKLKARQGDFDVRSSDSDTLLGLTVEDDADLKGVGHDNVV